MLGVNFYNLSDSVKTVKLKRRFKSLERKYSFEKALSKFLNEKSYSSLDTSLVGTYRILYLPIGGDYCFKFNCIKLIGTNLEIKELYYNYEISNNFKLLNTRTKLISNIEIQKFTQLIRIAEIENLSESTTKTCSICPYIQLETLVREFNYPPNDFKYIKIQRNTNNKLNNFNIACNYLLDLAEVKNRY